MRAQTARTFKELRCRAEIAHALFAERLGLPGHSPVYGRRGSSAAMAGGRRSRAGSSLRPPAEPSASSACAAACSAAAAKRVLGASSACNVHFHAFIPSKHLTLITWHSSGQPQIDLGSTSARNMS